MSYTGMSSDDWKKLRNKETTGQDMKDFDSGNIGPVAPDSKDFGKYEGYLKGREHGAKGKKGDKKLFSKKNVTGEKLMNTADKVISTLKGDPSDGHYDVSMTPLSDSSKNFTMARAPSEGILSDADRKELDKMYG